MATEGQQNIRRFVCSYRKFVKTCGELKENLVKILHVKRHLRNLFEQIQNLTENFVAMDAISTLKDEKSDEKFQKNLDEGVISAETKVNIKAGKSPIISNFFYSYLHLLR